MKIYNFWDICTTFIKMMAENEAFVKVESLVQQGLKII